jgi:hypothetical protein
MSKRYRIDLVTPHVDMQNDDEQSNLLSAKCLGEVALLVGRRGSVTALSIVCRK